MPPPPPPPVEAVVPAEPQVIEAAPATPPHVELATAPAPMPEAAAGGDMETPTMAELYAAQGHFDKAVVVYRNLLIRDPNETTYLERIEELEMLANASAESANAAPGARPEPRGDAHSAAGTRETIEALEQWLDGIRRPRGA